MRSSRLSHRKKPREFFWRILPSMREVPAFYPSLVPPLNRAVGRALSTVQAERYQHSRCHPVIVAAWDCFDNACGPARVGALHGRGPKRHKPSKLWLYFCWTSDGRLLAWAPGMVAQWILLAFLIPPV